jgi:hypothetical protein
VSDCARCERLERAEWEREREADGIFHAGRIIQRTEEVVE